MDKLESMRVYVQVVETRSFARTAEALGLPRSTVSRVIKELENGLGLQLLQRTTRKLSVTAEGNRYYEASKRILDDITALESSFPGTHGQPAGRLKIGMPQSLARHCILPRLGEFLHRYPQLAVTLCSSDNVEDVIQEGYDCVIRTGRVEDSTTLVARSLAKFSWVVLASPQYIAQYGNPADLQALRQHKAVGYLNHRTGRTTDWLLSHAGDDHEIRLSETLIVDDTDAYIQAGIQGLGLIRVASYLAQPCLASGALVRCMENYTFDLPLSLVYPQSRYLPPSVRAFYDWSKAVLNQQ